MAEEIKGETPRETLDPVSFLVQALYANYIEALSETTLGVAEYVEGVSNLSDCMAQAISTSKLIKLLSNEEELDVFTSQLELVSESISVLQPSYFTIYPVFINILDERLISSIETIGNLLPIINQLHSRLSLLLPQNHGLVMALSKIIKVLKNQIGSLESEAMAAGLLQANQGAEKQSSTIFTLYGSQDWLIDHLKAIVSQLQSDIRKLSKIQRLVVENRLLLIQFLDTTNTIFSNPRIQEVIRDDAETRNMLITRLENIQQAATDISDQLQPQLDDQTELNPDQRQTANHLLFQLQLIQTACGNITRLIDEIAEQSEAD